MSNSLTAERAVIAAISGARTNPSAVAAKIHSRLAHFKGRDYHPPSRAGAVIPTKEGVAAVNEALAFLKDQVPLAPVEVPQNDTARLGMFLAAQDHLVDRGENGMIGHEGADGSSSSDRVQRYGLWSGTVGEVMWFGRSIDPDEVVCDLIIDDGVATRGHRLCIFDERHRVAVAAIAPHRTFGQMVVTLLAAEYVGDETKVAARQAAGAKHITSNAKVATQWTHKLGSCVGCKQVLHGGAIMETKLGKYHKDCFICTECSTPLAGVPFRIEGGKPYCTECATQLFAPTCHHCGKRVSGSYVKAGGNVYHKECSPSARGAGTGSKLRTVTAMASQPTRASGRGSGRSSSMSMPRARENVDDLVKDFAGL